MTCLVGMPGYEITDFKGFVTYYSCTAYENTSQCTAHLIRNLNATLPWHPQELDLLGSQAVGNKSHNWTQTCVVFGDRFQGLSGAGAVLAKLLGVGDHQWSPFHNEMGWTVVSLKNERDFSIWGPYSGYNGNRSLGAYGASYKAGKSVTHNESLWNNGTAKALPQGMFLICGD